tara:strand:- start:662 stop:799 length:138 start_codon:yes stop_codon:yes gene_type:complete
MKNLANNISKLDGLVKGGITFIALVLLPLGITVIVDVINSGSNML